MKCLICGEEITLFKVVGVCDFNNFDAKSISADKGNVPLLIDSNFYPIAMITCSCGSISMVTVERAMRDGLTQDRGARGDMKLPRLDAEGHGE